MVSFAQIYFLGLLLRDIERSKLDLQVKFNGILISALRVQTKEEFAEKLKGNVSDLNKKISKFNKFKDSQFSYIGVSSIGLISIEKITAVINDHSEHTKTGVEHTVLKLNSILTKLNYEISKIYSDFDGLYDKVGGRERWRDLKVRPQINKLMKEAFDIYTIGYSGTALFVAGKTLETVLIDYSFMLKKKNALSENNEEISNWNFDTRINKLNKERFLTPTEYSKMMSVKWERNNTGHKSVKENQSVFKSDVAMMLVAFETIEIVELKIRKLKNKKIT